MIGQCRCWLVIAFLVVINLLGLMVLSLYEKNTILINIYDMKIEDTASMMIDNIRLRDSLDIIQHKIDSIEGKEVADAR